MGYPQKWNTYLLFLFWFAPRRTPPEKSQLRLDAVKLANIEYNNNNNNNNNSNNNNTNDNNNNNNNNNVGIQTWANAEYELFVIALWKLITQ